jgi:hypothetical protein
MKEYRKRRDLAGDGATAQEFKIRKTKKNKNRKKTKYSLGLGV